MASEKLTATQVAKARAPGMKGDGKGLWLRIARGGSKNWIFRFMLAGRAHEMGLGSAADVSLAEARDLARKARHSLQQGIDPIEQRRAHRTALQLEAAKAMSFRECAEAYIAAHEAGWRNAKHRAQWPATLETYVYPIFGALPVQVVDVALVMKVLEPVWATKPETAGRVRGRIESVLDWATARGYRQGENPARWRGHLENLLPKKSKVRRVEHHAALSYAEIGGFMAALRLQEGTAARALEFAILTAARTGEVLGARWTEIDFAARLWVVPPSRMKAGREHRVPLSAAALAVLQDMEVRDGDFFVFPGARPRRPLSAAAMLRALAEVADRDGLTVHGFRSSFSDWCAEQTNFPAELREMALAHAVGDKVEAAYRRGDLFEKRRRLMEAWARHCAAPARRSAEIVPLAG